MSTFPYQIPSIPSKIPMDRPPIFELSSDDEVGFDNTSTDDNFDWFINYFEDAVAQDHNHLSDYCPNTKDVVVDDDDDDDDDVVVVGEVIVNNPIKPKPLIPNNELGGDDDDDDDDDDCVVLDGDPNKLDNPKDEVKDPQLDEDDLLIVSEKGQVACRDYPHARHLCAKFPFISTPHESCCDLCHCYVCDSVAPCSFWGSGVLSTDHCHATDKEEYWKHERKRARQVKNPPPPIPTSKPDARSLPQLPQKQHISTRPNQISRPTSTCGVPSTFGLPNIIRSQRSSIAVASNRFQPHLVSRQLSRNGNAQVQGNRGASLAPRMSSSRPMFKRSRLTHRPAVANQSAYHTQKSINLAHLRLPNHQLTGNLAENNSANSTMSSLHLNSDPSFVLPRASSVSPGTFPLPLQGYNQPSHTPTSHFHGNGHPAALTSNSPYTYTSMNQMQNVSDLVPPCETYAQNITTPCSEQHSAVTQNISGSNFTSRTRDILSSITQSSHQTSVEPIHPSPVFSGSIPSALNGVAQTCQPPAAETSVVGGGVPMHELLPSLEQKDFDFEFEHWLRDSESILRSQEDSVLLDMNNQVSVPAPVDAGMVYIDFETSWNGLTHL